MEFDLAPQINRMEKDLLSVNIANIILRKSKGRGIEEYIKKAFNQTTALKESKESDNSRTTASPGPGLKKSIKNKTILYKGVSIKNPEYIFKQGKELRKRKVQFDL